MAHMPTHIRVEVDAINTDVFIRLMNELEAERQRVERVRALVTEAEKRIRSSVPPSAAKMLIMVGDVKVISLRDLREAVGDEDQ